MESFLGPNPIDALGRMWTSTSQMSDLQVRNYVTNVVKKYPVNGSNAITVLSFRNKPIVLLGEIHDNENRCKPSPKYDVLKHLVMKIMKENQNTVLIVEGFPESLAKPVSKLKANIEKYRHSEFLKCLQACDFQCQYTKGEGNLAILRLVKLLVHTSHLVYPRNKFVQTLNERIQYFDLRVDLDMKNPFVDWQKVASPVNYIRDSLRNIRQLPMHMHAIPFRPWQEEFEERVLHPFLHRANVLAKHPTANAYTDFFIDLPDAMAVNLILCTLCQGRIPILYAGENHRRGVLSLLRKFSFFPFMKVLAESQDPQDGSCSRPTTRRRSFLG